MVAEAPFRPREQLIEKQRLFQSIHKHTHLKGPMDKLTSVAIPMALAGSCLFLIVSSFVLFPSARSGKRLNWAGRAGWIKGQTGSFSARINALGCPSLYVQFSV